MSQYGGVIGGLGENPFTTNDSSPTHSLGAVMSADNNRRFVYAKVGSLASVRGSMYAAPAEDTNHQNLAIVAAAVGAKTIVTTTTITVTANQYAGGFLVVAVTPGLGQVLKIKSHPAATAAVVTFELEDPVLVALTTVSRLDLVANPYNGVIIDAATPTGTPIGIAVNAITAGNFGWFQTWGPAPFLADGTVTVDDALSTSNATAGALEVGVAGQPNVGYAMSGVATTETGLCFLRLS